MRIIQISDLHFGMHEQAIIDPFLQDLRQLQPERVIISGDVTQRALPGQYLLFQDFLKQLPPALVVPGNHDIPLYDFYERLINPFKNYRRYVSPELEAHFINDKINILGVNSVTPYKLKDGLLSKKTIKTIEQHFSADSGQVNILFFHHNLHYFSGMHHPLNNAEEFIEFLKNSPIHLVCTGHLHYSTLKLFTKNDQKPCAILHAGSLLCQRRRDKKNGYYVIDIEGMNCRIDWRVFSENQFISEQIHLVEFD